MRKNEPTATLRVAGPIPFLDLDGALKKNLSFATGSSEVFYYRSATNDWAATASNATELGGANTTGIYYVQMSQAETNQDFVVGIKLVKSGYADQFWFAAIDNAPDVNVATIAANAITASAIATDAIDADALKTDAITEIQSGLALATDLATLTGYVDTEVAAIKSKTDNLPSDPADASDIAALFATVNTKLDTIDDFIDTEVAAIKAKTDNLPSDPADASDIAADFATVNSTLSTIAGYIDTEVAAIKAKTDNLPSDPADASDIAALFATVNTKLDTIDDYIDTEVAAIKAKTDNLPSDPADASDIAALFATVNTKLDTIDDFIDTEVAAIKAKTDNLPSDPADASVVAGLIASVPGLIWEELTSSHTTAGTYGELLQSPTGTVVSDGSNSNITFKTNLTETGTDAFKDAFCCFLDGALKNQVHKVTGYNGSTKFLTFTSPSIFTAAPVAATRFVLITK